ncbi:CDP-alcohol phosphatidyltransferase family protein [uncultured Jatrophihabitans sp.]|uniref:CDP-alcohol phosphatidyltransferase family protein n=1 Tax=uncultured Jatrophihabitans sp. TaxID=1610747 RepID=UPI0035CC8161
MTSPFRRCPDYTSAQVRSAWLLHGFTTLGIVAAMLALRDVLVDRPSYAIIWLLLTLLIDGVDGPIARALEVEKRVPGLDGFLLDLIIDYVTCVIVPACFMFEFKVVPQNNFGIAVLCFMVFTSAIWFARKDMMTDDNWFRGFPAAWNIVGPLLFLLEARTWVGASITIVLSILCLTNMPYPHIARARWAQRYTIVATVCWIGGISVGTLTYPHHYVVAAVLMWAGSAYFVALAGARTLHDRRLRRDNPAAPLRPPDEHLDELASNTADRAPSGSAPERR